MRQDPRVIGLLSLFEAFRRPCSFYVLGAGASYPIIPLTDQLCDRVVNRHIKSGLYPVFERGPDQVFDRIVGNCWQYDNIPRSRLLSLYPSAIRAMLLKELCSPRLKRVPCQYAIFYLASRSSTIFTFNVDGLARFLSHRHYIIEPHGSLQLGSFRNPKWDKLIDAYMEYGGLLPDPILSGLQFPGQEPSSITRSCAYTKASRLIRYANNVVLVGYSFGIYGGVLDDAESFAFLVDHIMPRHMTLTIVDPKPEQVADVFGAACKLKKCVQLNVSWSALSRAIMELVRMLGIRSSSDMIHLTGEILRRHDELRERDAQNSSPADSGKPRSLRSSSSLNKWFNHSA